MAKNESLNESLKALLDAYLSPSPESALKTALGSVDDLPALIEAAKAESEKMYEEFNSITDKEAKDAAAAEIKALTKVIKTAAAEHDRKIEDEAKQQAEAQAKSEVDEAFKSLKDLKLTEAPKVEAKPEGDVKPDVKTDAPSKSEDAPVAAKIETPAPQGEPTPAVATPPVEPAPAAPQGELVGAGAGSGQFSAAGLPPQGALPPTVTRPTGEYSNVFAVSMNGGMTGQKLTSAKEVVSALSDTYRMYPTRSRGNGVWHRVAAYQRPEVEEFSVYGNRDNDQETIDRVASKPLEWDPAKGQFAAGWCAPEETLYELCPQISTGDGLVDLPTVTARRGSLQFTKAPDFAVLYADPAVGQVLTEANVIAEQVKTCIEIDCPDFTTVTLDVNPLCVTGNLLTHAGYPEYEQRFISEVMTANEHKINANIIARMVAASNAFAVTAPPTLGPVDTSSVSQFLDYTSLYATVIRERYRTSLTQIVEFVVPQWYRQHMAADLSRRNGVDLLVAQARIDEALRERNIRVQWVHDWQMLLTPATPGAPTNAELAAVANSRRATVQILGFLPGTFVKATNPVINLGVLHSAAQLSLNQYTAMFVETGFAVFERCWDSFAITIPICPSGTTGAASGSCDVTP